MGNWLEEVKNLVQKEEQNRYIEEKMRLAERQSHLGQLKIFRHFTDRVFYDTEKVMAQARLQGLLVFLREPGYHPESPGNYFCIGFPSDVDENGESKNTSWGYVWEIHEPNLHQTGIISLGLNVDHRGTFHPQIKQKMVKKNCQQEIIPEDIEKIIKKWLYQIYSLKLDSHGAL